MSVPTYTDDLDEDAKSNSRARRRRFPHLRFLAAILPYTNAAWEKLSIFLNLLIPKLPAPLEEDLSPAFWNPSTWTVIA